MLKRIQCDEFKTFDGAVRPPIEFHKGLNAVIGNESGTNSVGKSTFLMIPDFRIIHSKDSGRSNRTHRVPFISLVTLSISAPNAAPLQITTAFVSAFDLSHENTAEFDPDDTHLTLLFATTASKNW